MATVIGPNQNGTTRSGRRAWSTSRRPGWSRHAVRTRGKIDLFNVLDFAAHSLLESFREDDRAQRCNAVSTALAGATVALTDWEAPTGRGAGRAEAPALPAPPPNAEVHLRVRRVRGARRARRPVGALPRLRARVQYNATSGGARAGPGEVVARELLFVRGGVVPVA